MDAHALGAARARRRAGRARGRPPRVRGRSIWAAVVAVVAARVREGLRPLRAAHALHGGRAAGAGADRAQHPQASNDATSANESSTSEHLASLRDGGRTVLHHPWGFGLGNSGVTAARTHVTVKAGESTYTELGVETGLLGVLVFVAWSLALLAVDAAQARVARRGLRCGALARPPDRRDRRAVDRRHRLGARRRLGVTATTSCRSRTDTCGAGAPFVPLIGCVSHSSSSVCSSGCRRRRGDGAAALLGRLARRRRSCARAGRGRPASSTRRSRRRRSARRSAAAAGRAPSAAGLVHERAQGAAARAVRLRGPPSAFQEDHLISLELGGNPTDPRNLWPEPYPRAAAVDRIENELNARVCAGSLTLAEAQRRESSLKHAAG